MSIFPRSRSQTEDQNDLTECLKLGQGGLKAGEKKPTSPDSLGDMSCSLKIKPDSLSVSNWHFWTMLLKVSVSDISLMVSNTI